MFFIVYLANAAFFHTVMLNYIQDIITFFASILKPQRLENCKHKDATAQDMTFFFFLHTAWQGSEIF